MENYSWVTLVATNDFIPGAINLYNSLKKVNTKYPFLVMVTTNITDKNLQKLNDLNIPYIRFPYLSFTGNGPVEEKAWKTTPEQEKNLYWDCTLSKFYIFTLTQYDKIMFVDADVELIQNCDHYFDYDTPAGGYPPWTIDPKYMNGGIFLIKPSLEDFIKCIRIGIDNNFLCDEDVLHLWYPEFANNLNQIFPQTDIWELEDQEDLSVRRIMHHDGPIKPWMK